MNKTPDHIAIIMDGNRRWAEINNLDKIQGHKSGIEAAKEICLEAQKLDVQELTLYAFSLQNWKRPRIEVESLFNLFIELFEDKSKFFTKNNFIFNPVGRLNDLNPIIKNQLNKLKELTSNNKNLKINVAINYGGIEEITDVVKKVLSVGIKINEISIDLIKKLSYFPNSPDPEIIIRTGGHSRISNFLNLHNSYSEIIISEKLWPDFNKDDLQLIIKKYKMIDRKYGK